MGLRALLLWVMVLILPGQAAAQIPPGYPRDYGATIAAANREGKLVIYGATDLWATRYLIKDFRALYPRLEVDYQEVSSLDLYHRFLEETKAGRPTADVLWSSAMDLQVKLVNDGYAQAYDSPEIPHLPPWAVWKNEAFGTTFEPVGFAYNTRRIAPHEVPRSHGDLARLLAGAPERFKGKVITYDLERSGLGFLFAAQDARITQQFWELARALGQAETRMNLSSAEMLESVASGQSLIAYNLLGSYAHSGTDPAVGLVYPRDYTLVVSRIAFVSRNAPHPHAARLWLDYLLSKRGQTVLAQQAGLFALRADVEGERTAAALRRALGTSLMPVAIGPSLMAYLDRRKRQDFLERWRKALGR